MDYAVIYSSVTGNTEKIAMAIFAALPGKSKDVLRVEEAGKAEADLYFIGFWNNRGTCSSEIMDFMAGLHGKKIALFGTCGMGGSQEYFDRVANQVSALIPDDNEYLGSFLCAGRMPPQVLEKYKHIQEIEDSPRVRRMISGYEEAMLHPNEKDYEAARAFARSILKR